MRVDRGKRKDEGVEEDEDEDEEEKKKERRLKMRLVDRTKL